MLNKLFLMNSFQNVSIDDILILADFRPVTCDEVKIPESFDLDYLGGNMSIAYINSKMKTRDNVKNNFFSCTELKRTVLSDGSTFIKLSIV